MKNNNNNNNNNNEKKIGCRTGWATAQICTVTKGGAGRGAGQAPGAGGGARLGAGRAGRHDRQLGEQACRCAEHGRAGHGRAGTGRSRRAAVGLAGARGARGLGAGRAA